MTVPKGSTVVISHLPNGESISCALDEDFSLNLSSSFKPLIGDNQNTVLTTLGGALKSMTGFGGSGQIKQAGFQIWERTDPIQLSCQLGFYRTLNAKNDISKDVQTLLSLPLPGETGKGILVPPGPSIIEALGHEPKADGVDSYVNVAIGGIVLKKCILKQAEPTYNKRQDSSGYPISVRVSVSFMTMYSGTKPQVSSL